MERKKGGVYIYKGDGNIYKFAMRFKRNESCVSFK